MGLWFGRFNDTWKLLWSIGNQRLTLGELLDGDQGAADEEEAATDQIECCPQGTIVKEKCGDSHRYQGVPLNQQTLKL